MSQNGPQAVAFESLRVLGPNSRVHQIPPTSAFPTSEPEQGRAMTLAS
jgi:hypothetical protein